MAPASSLSAALSSPPLASGLFNSLLPSLPTPAHHQILDLLGVARSPELTLPARAGLIVGVCTAVPAASAPAGSPRLRPPAAAAVAGSLLATRGSDLTRLKEAVNLAAPGQLDLFTLMFRRMDGGARAELLQHIAVEGARAVAAAGGAPLSFKVVSDFDDTLRQGWVDRRVPRRVWYPGARAFLAELRAQACAWGGEALAAAEKSGGAGPGAGGDFSLGWWARECGEAPPARTARAREQLCHALFTALAGAHPCPPPPPMRQDVPGSMALVSARPPMMRRLTMRNVPGVGESPPPAPPAASAPPSPPASDSEASEGVDAAALGPLFAMPPPLPATAVPVATPPPFHATLLMSSSVFRAATVGGIVAEKVENVSHLRCLWPEYAWLLLGDAGQGDAAVAAPAAARYGLSAPGGALAAALLHDVTPGVHTTGDGGLKAGYAAGGQALFSTYAGAAAAAAARGLLSREALWRVCAATAAEAEALAWAGHAGASEARSRLLAAVGRDLRAAGWPGCAALGAAWAEAEARVAGAEGAEAAAQAAGLGDAQQPSDLRLAAWAASRG